MSSIRPNTPITRTNIWVKVNGAESLLPDRDGDRNRYGYGYED